MPSLQAYDRSLDYSYALGLFPAMEALTKRPDLVRRVLLHSKAAPSPALQNLRAFCETHGIRIEEADRALAKYSGKENVFAAAVIAKEEAVLEGTANHLVLHNPGDKGNLGTILRAALGFDFLDIAIIRPAADRYDPQVIRASMGALFSLRVAEFDGFDAYRSVHKNHQLYPLMLQGSELLNAAAVQATAPYALVLGNEGSGLPAEFSTLGSPVRIPHSDRIDSLNLAVAASIAMYAFRFPNNN